MVPSLAYFQASETGRQMQHLLKMCKQHRKYLAGCSWLGFSAIMVTCISTVACQESLLNSSVVDIMLLLSVNVWPDITVALHHCVKFEFI